MEKFFLDKKVEESINAADLNDYLYDLYLNSSSSRKDIRKGFRRFVAATDLKKRRDMSALHVSSIVVAMASVIFAVCILFAKKPIATEWTSVYTAAGENKELLLDDGTRLHLGPCSSVLYPDSFTGTERKVFAVGDVYFEVAKDESLPFVVSANDINIKVHGTVFHLYSYPGVDDQEVSLAQGSVSVSFGDENKGTIYLEPGEMLTYNEGRNICTKMAFNVDSFQDQMLGKQIFFDNEDLMTISRKLTNRFGVKVIVCDKSLMGQKYYASFVNGEGLEEILSTLSKKGQFSIKHVGDDYLIIN